MSETYPKVTIGRTERLPNDGVRRCGSSAAHAMCRFRGNAEGYLLGCDATGPMWSHCPYHAIGTINIYDGETTT
jgi:hypothetical protein